MGQRYCATTGHLALLTSILAAQAVNGPFAGNAERHGESNCLAPRPPRSRLWLERAEVGDAAVLVFGQQHAAILKQR
jgi:hypothetical protein